MKQIKVEITKEVFIIRIIMAIETTSHMLMVVARIELDKVELVGIAIAARKNQVIAIEVALQEMKEVEEEIPDELVLVYSSRLYQVL
jgi:hypothetical protein